VLTLLGIKIALIKRDFIMRIKNCHEGSKESAYWLRLIVETNEERWRQEGEILPDEAPGLKKIFCSIPERSK
jgi:hypothetical protein